MSANQDELFNKTLEQLFPIYQKWMKKVKGYHTAGMSLASLKLWYEFITFVKKVK